MKEKHGRSLVIGPSWVGDMVMAHSLFRLLRAQSPEGGLDVLAPPWTRPLVEFMPEVDSANARLPAIANAKWYSRKEWYKRGFP